MVTGCHIPAKQNEEAQMNILAAASHVYAQAKRLMGVQFILTVPAALISSLLMAWRPNWKIWLTSFSVTVALVDALWLSRAQVRLKRRGAKLQQMFDCALFELPWRPLRCGSPIDSTDVFTHAKNHLAIPAVKDGLLDWYPKSVGNLPLPLARLVCQWVSLWWDLRQRDRVRGMLTLILSVLAATVFLIALAQGDTVEQMILTVYVPLAPAVLWIIREMLAQRDAIKADERGLAYVAALWKRALTQGISDADLSSETLIVQDALFDARSRSPMVFNWVYNLLRRRHQEQMEHKAAALVDEATASFSKTK
jgi:hypothetical protein